MKRFETLKTLLTQIKVRSEDCKRTQKCTKLGRLTGETISTRLPLHWRPKYELAVKSGIQYLQSVLLSNLSGRDRCRLREAKGRGLTRTDVERFLIRIVSCELIFLGFAILLVQIVHNLWRAGKRAKWTLTRLTKWKSKVQIIYININININQKAIVVCARSMPKNANKNI